MSKLPLILGQAYLPILHNRDAFILVEGPRGTLKTCSILNIIMLRAAQWPGKRWNIWRSTRALLSKTVLPSFEEYIIPMWAKVRGMALINPGARPDHRTEYLFENGTVITPIGLDDILRGTSSEAAGGYLAEAIELHALNQITALAGMLRQPGVPFHQIIVDYNPGSPNHFLERKSEPFDPKLRRVVTRADYERLQAHNRQPATDPVKRWKRIVTKLQDNHHFFDVDKWELTPAGKQYLEKLGAIDGFLFKRWVLGEPAAQEGGVFPEFGQANIVQPFKIPSHWPRYMIYDPGHGHPTGIAWVAQAPTGTLFVYDEIYTPGYALGDFATWIKLKEEEMGNISIRRYADPRGAFSHDAKDPRSIADIMAEDYGLIFDEWPSLAMAHKQAGVEAVRQRVKDQTLKVFATCAATINEFQSWRYKHDAGGVIRVGDDAYEDANNEIMDGLIGLVATNPTTAITGGFVSSKPAESGQWGEPVDEDYREPQGPGDEIRPPDGGFEMMR